MAIQCNKEFSLTLHYYSQGYKQTCPINLASNLEQLLQEPSLYTLKITENITYELGFTAEDLKARLYIEGLDQVEGSHYDAQCQQYYKLPQHEPFIWFRWDVSHRGMIPGSYYIKVKYKQKWYYGVLNVEPKHMDTEQLQQMREEVEELLLRWKELPTGIQESLYQKTSYHQTQDNERVTTVLAKSHRQLIQLLNEFRNHPYEQIEKIYHTRQKEMSQKSDPTAIRKTLTKTTDQHKVFGYTKSMTYETQENKWIKCLNERLLRLIKRLDLTNEDIQEKESINKLEKACQQFKKSEWYHQIQCRGYEELPLRSRYDSRYRMLFQLDYELRQEVQKISLKRTYQSLWLETSWIYELWCFLKVYKALVESLGYKEIERIKSGYLLNKGEVFLKLHYDTEIPLHLEGTSKEENPLYTRSPLHTRPDGRIDIYKHNQYYGSIILEFKYSGYYNIWNSQRRTRCSEQLLHYAYQLGSPYLFNRYQLPSELFKQMQPVYRVIAIVPKLDKDIDLIEDEETHIVQVGLRLEKDNTQWVTYIDQLIQQITV